MPKLMTTIFLIMISGCAGKLSQQDFTNLSTDDKAKVICNSTNSHLEREEQLHTLGNALKDQEALLAAGIRQTTTCRMTNESECAICAVKLVNRCTDHVVAIDSRYESEMRDKYSAALDVIRESHRREHQACVKKVAQMPPSQAYALYISGATPKGIPSASDSASKNVNNVHGNKKAVNEEAQWSAPTVTEGDGRIFSAVGSFGDSPSKGDASSYHRLILTRHTAYECLMSATYVVVTRAPLLFTAPKSEAVRYMMTLGNYAVEIEAHRKTPDDRQSSDFSYAEYNIVVPPDLVPKLMEAPDTVSIVVTPIQDPSNNYSFEWNTKKLSSRMANIQAMCAALKGR